MEPERLQEEIAAQLATDRSIAAGLLACPGSNSANAPHFEENGVVFWRRK